jgi:DNA replication protein DnaC
VKSSAKTVHEIIPAGRRAQVEEHRRRYATDPAYREEADREKIESDRQWEARLQSERETTQRLDAAARLQASRIPEREASFLSCAKLSEPLEAALEFMASDKTLFFLAGNTGTGKTIAACVAAWRAPGSVRFVKAIELVQHGAFDPEYWDDLRGARTLVIDDLGTEPLDVSGWGLSCILGLIDERYDARHKTFVTVNKTMEEFFSRYGMDGGRLRDRLREAGMFVEFSGPSLRGNHV